MAEALHYYPGHFHKASDLLSGTTDTYLGGGLLVFIKDGKAVYKSEAWGGLSKTHPDPGGGSDYTPTPSGTFLLENPAAYRTRSWHMSQIKWGTPIKDSPNERGLTEGKKKDVWYRLNNGNWASMLKDYGIKREDVISFHEQLYGSRIVPKIWIFNAFGPVAIRYYRDLNSNGKRDENEPLDGSMFHTTAENEAEFKQGQPLKMVNSHGCIHLKPGDRAHLTSISAFKNGMTLIIHPYSVKYTPK